MKLFVSGGLSEEKILELNPVVDGGYGVGTSISSASTIDFSMDIVEVDGVAVAKRGKRPGAKHLLRCRDCGEERVIPIDKPYGDCASCGGVVEQLLAGVMKNGEREDSGPSAKEIRNYVLRQIHRVNL